MNNLRKYFDSLTIFIIAMVIMTIITFALRSELQTSEERRDMNQLVIVHNQGVMIKNQKINEHNAAIITHNQLQFSKYGFGNPTLNYTTPNIRTDVQNVSTDYWSNFTSID